MTTKEVEHSTAGRPVLPPDAEERAERLGQYARWLMVAYVAVMGCVIWFFQESQPMLWMAVLVLTIPFFSTVSVHRETENLIEALRESPNDSIHQKLQTTRRWLRLTIAAAGALYVLAMAVALYVLLEFVFALASYAC